MRTIPKCKVVGRNPCVYFFIIWLQTLNLFLPVSCDSEAVFIPSSHRIPPDMRFVPIPMRSFYGLKPKYREGQEQLPASSQKSGERYGQVAPDVEGSAYQEKQQLQQLLPMGYVFPHQFPKSVNPVITNQANGPSVEKDSPEEPETNEHLPLVLKDYDLPPSHVAVRSRGSHIHDGGEPLVKRSQGLSGTREGYMCHFKLCQFGASGKRRWSPLFEFD